MQFYRHAILDDMIDSLQGNPRFKEMHAETYSISQQTPSYNGGIGDAK